MPDHLTRRTMLTLGTALPWATDGRAATKGQRSFSVLQLLRPNKLQIVGKGEVRLHCARGERSWLVEPGNPATLTAAGMPITISGPDGCAVCFVLEIPGVIQREYRGTLLVEADGDVLRPIITMDTETAVSSIVAAELPLGIASQAALEAQSIVARSYLEGTSQPRHQHVWFCDTTHCQFLRSPARDGSAMARAVARTEGIVLVSGSQEFPALYSAACGGVTENGKRGGFQYAPVICDVCLKNGFGRRGHGWGLCQEGAMGLAKQGWRASAILTKYFPGAEVRAL